MGRPLAIAGSVAGLILVLGLAACGDDKPSDEGASDGAEHGVELDDVERIDGPEADVRAIDNEFEAENIQVAPGTRVVWSNDGRQDHDIIPVDEDAGWGIEPADFQPDATYEYTFEQPGTYRYYCSLHGTEDAGMTGAVVVKD